MENKAQVGVIVARMQTPYLHEGHIDLINRVRESHSKVIIVLGISPIIGSLRSPYDYFTREKMIKEEFSDVLTLPLSDQPDDKVWSKNLDGVISGCLTSESCVLYGSRDSFAKSYTGKFKVVELPQKGDYNASEIRDTYKHKVLSDPDFRMGVLYAYSQQYPTSYATVDIACFKNKRKQILLGKKPNETTWRFPGGFVDPRDASYEVAAFRELQEECGKIDVGNIKYEMSMNVDDWRYKGERNCIKTMLFSCEYTFGIIEAGDDLNECKWINTSDLPQMKAEGRLHKNHIKMFDHIINLSR